MKKAKLNVPEEVCHWQYLPTSEAPIMHWSRRDCFKAKMLMCELQGNKPDIELAKKVYNGQRCSHCNRIIQIVGSTTESDEEKVNE